MEQVAHIGPLCSRYSLENWYEILDFLDETWEKCQLFERTQRGVVYILMSPSIGQSSEVNSRVANLSNNIILALPRVWLFPSILFSI